ncbi:unnamed protein product [Durusdinium trenchii]|uniref:RING-type domain-containing protein n=1 Tax=Durusdinium trenchii TaxID=1381693 RepID=A0ABP0K310_9DINO
MAVAEWVNGVSYYDYPHIFLVALDVQSPFFGGGLAGSVAENWQLCSAHVVRQVDQVMLDSIESVPFDIKLFTEDASASEGLMPAECCVCCERFGREKVIKRTPCNHVFHEDCLARWLKVTDSCPVCRKSMRKVEDPEWGPSEECAPTSPTSPASDGESFENT